MRQQWSGGGVGGGLPATTNNASLSKKDMFNDWQVAAIKGWSCIKETTRIQRFGQTIQGVKQDQIIRTEVRRGMDAWAKWKGQQIETRVFLLKDIIKCIKKVTPCPGEPIPTFANADKGIDPLACCPWKSDEIKLEQEKESAVEETAATRTYNEQVQMSARPGKDPPSTFLVLQVMLATYCALLWVLFGGQCALYLAVLDIYLLLKDDYIAMQQHEFTPLRCREITWAVICDAKRFFHTQVHPSELTQPNPQYPVSRLASVLLDIQNMVPVVQDSLPFGLANGAE